MADQIGTWKVDIRADTAPVIKDIKQVEDQIVRSSRASSQGLLAISQAVDDIQYGFRSIVNNIPQIALGLGGGAGLAGAAGILAVGLSQVINHWDGLVAAFTGNEVPFPKMRSGIEGLTESVKELGEEIDKLKKKMESGPEKLLGFESGIQPGFMDTDRLAKLQQMKKEAEGLLQVEQDMKHLERSSEEDATASAVKKGIKGAGGSAAVLEALITGGMTPAEAKKALSEASRGQAGYLEDVLGALPQNDRKFDALFGAHPEARKASEEADLKAKEIDVERAFQEKKKRDDNLMADKLNRDAEENRRLQLEGQRKERIEDLQDKKQLIQDQLHADLQDIGPNKPGSVMAGGAKALIDMYQSGTGGREEKAQKLREQANKLLKSIDDNIKKERRLVLER